MQVKIISMTPRALDVIASAYAITRGMSYDEYAKKYDTNEKIKNLIQKCFNSGHISGFEFVDIDVEVIGFSRVFEAQKIRTRHASYEIESGRQKEKRFKLVKPNSVNKETHNNMEEKLQEQYNELIKQGVPYEDARYYLPQGLQRIGRIKQNMSSWIHTSGLRMCACAQWEYRDFMSKLKKEITKKEPFLAEFLQPYCVHRGYCQEEYNPCGKYLVKKDVLLGRIDWTKILDRKKG